MLASGSGLDRLNRLDVRLVLLLGLALLPIGIIAMVQTYRVIADSDSRLESALLGRTLEAAASERQLVLRMRGAAQSIAATLPAYVDQPETCGNVLGTYASSIPEISFAGFIDNEGTIRCATDGIGMDVSDGAIFTQFQAIRVPFVSSAAKGRITGSSVLVVVEPVMIGGESAGLLAISVPHDALVPGEYGQEDPKPVDTVTFNISGTVLTSEQGLESAAERMPVNRALPALTGPGPSVFRDMDANGDERIYTVAPLIQDTVYAMSIWPVSAGRTGGLTAMSAVLFPFLMWLASLSVAYFAVHRLVIRHIRTLRRSIRAFSHSRRVLETSSAEEAPVELREVIQAFGAMTEQIIRDEATLENGLHEKDVLLKEVHHRVKNNLQLIASITNMQIRKSRHEETRFALKRLQDRVLGLATIHRNLYRASVLSHVRADALVGELIEQMSQTMIQPDSGVRFSVDVSPVNLYPDQAVPLALLVTEATTNALKYLGRPEDGSQPYVEITLRAAGPTQSVYLTIANSMGDPVNPRESSDHSGLGSQLINAFVMQLGASIETKQHPDRYLVEVSFTPSEFVQDEEAA